MKLILNDQAHRQRQEAFKSATNARLRARCQAILMAARGRRHRHIAADLGVSVRTIQRLLYASHDQRLAGLKLRWVPGRTRPIPEALTSTILTWIMPGPAGCGLDRAHWPSAELAAQLDQTHGMVVSASTMRAFCPTQGVRPSRPTSRALSKPTQSSRRRAHRPSRR
jgi:transposase